MSRRQSRRCSRRRKNSKQSASARWRSAHQLDHPRPNLTCLRGQALNSWAYRENLKDRCDAKSPDALRARSNAQTRDEKKAEKRKAARVLVAPPPPAPVSQPKKKARYVCVQSVEGRPIEGQCEGITQEGKRCCVHRENPRACARPLRAGGRFCSLHDPAVFTGTQCIALKRDGTRCRVFSGAAHVHAQPLRDGLHFCDHHKRWPMLGLPTAADCSDAAA